MLVFLSAFASNIKNPLKLVLSRKDLYETLLLEMTYHTNSIEGSTFNEPEVRAVLFDDVTIPKKTVREHQEAKNHQSALGFALRWLRDDGGGITKELVLKIHSILMNGILHNAGQYRNHSVRISGSNVPTSNPSSIEKHMDNLILLLNKKITDIAKDLAITHAQFEKIHPFSDGNGRVGRLLMLVVALKENYAPPLILKEKKTAYYNYLQEAQINENHIPLTSFIHDALIEGYQLLK